MITVETPSLQYAPLPEGATQDQRVSINVLEMLISPMSARNCRWAKRLDGERISIGMPQGCTLIVPANPAALTAAIKPACSADSTAGSRAESSAASAGAGGDQSFSATAAAAGQR